MTVQSRSLSSISALCALFFSSHAGAFELVYGAATEVDSGARGVRPVQFCPGGGFVSAGTRQAGNASDVYVVRTTPGGGTMFERRYDVGPGSILLIPAGVEHYIEPLGEEVVQNIDVLAPAREDYLHLLEWMDDARR